MIWLQFMGASIEEHARMHGFGSYPLIDVRDSYRMKALVGRGSAATSVVCGLLVLLRVECDKVVPCEGCLRILVEGIKPFVVRPGVEILKTRFPVRPLRSSLVFDIMPRDVRDQCAGFRARPRRIPRGLLHNQCGVSGGMNAFSDVTEGKERQKPASRRAKK
ncbi:hypothetical protein F2Q70_00003132 [Brassica cretica]|uniref:Uncharacterized protein n=1 Tax=Brassica cretica TaxID=69181 RepID=A0A8S9INF2_BRACR|nr:hypothetical protein F2Q70_00003132 [Brassica cretica]